MLEVLANEDGVGGLGDDDDALLGGPAEEDLSGGAVVLLGDGGDNVVLEESGALVGALPVKLAERDGAERRVSHHGDLLGLRELDQRLLSEVGVVLYRTNELTFIQSGRRLLRTDLED